MVWQKIKIAIWIILGAALLAYLVVISNYVLLRFIVGVAILAGLVYLLMFLLSMGMAGMAAAVAESFKPIPPEHQLKVFGKDLFNYEFTEGVEVLESTCNMMHGDFPQSLRIRLSEAAFSKFMVQIDQLMETKEKSVAKTETGFSADFEDESHYCEYAQIDVNNRTIYFRGFATF